MWSFREGGHWLPRAASWRKDWTPKPAGKVLEELLTKTWWTDTMVTTDAQGRATVRAFLGEHEVGSGGATTRVRLEKAGELVEVEVR